MGNIKIQQHPKFTEYVVITQLDKHAWLVDDVFVKKSDLPELIKKLSEFVSTND